MIEFQVTYEAWDDDPGRGWMQSHTDTFHTEMSARRFATTLFQNAIKSQIWRVEKTRIG